MSSFGHLTITPTENVKNNAIISSDKVKKVVIPSDDIVNIFNRNSQKYDKIKLIDISLFDNYIVLDSIKHYILHMLTKPEAI